MFEFARRCKIEIVGYAGHAMVSRLNGELTGRGHEVSVIPPARVATTVATHGTVSVYPFSDDSNVIVLTVSSDQVGAVQGVAQLQQAGVPVVNAPDAVMRAANKFRTATILAEAAVRVPHTVQVCTEEAAREQARSLGYPVILKAADGSEGDQVVFLTCEDDLAPAISHIRHSLGLEATVRSPLILQEVVHFWFGHDRRLFVAGGRVLAAMDRISREGEWRSNMSQGATPAAVTATAAEEAIALTAAKALGLDFGTVDLMYDEQGPVVIEVNPFGDVLDVAVMSGVDLVGSLADLAEIKAGVRAEPLNARMLSDADRSQLRQFCEERFQRKLEALGVAATAERVLAE